MTIGTDRLTARMARGCEFLSTEFAIMCGAMSWVSERNLVSAMSNAGGFGVIACGAMSPDLLDAEIAATASMTSKPFGVNLITMHPQLTDLIAVCGKHRVSHIVLAGGLPPTGSLDAIKATGAKVICFAPAAQPGEKADPIGRRCAGDRGDGGGRPYRPGIDQRAGAGNPAGRRG